jgi:hypothetical protein
MVDTIGQDGVGTDQLHAVRGYDPVTGLGSPGASFLDLPSLNRALAAAAPHP